jgi:hypothetical protein
MGRRIQRQNDRMVSYLAKNAYYPAGKPCKKVSQSEIDAALAEYKGPIEKLEIGPETPVFSRSAKRKR